MTSTNTYTPITPTYLYIKKHSVTGLKYFGKTTKDPIKYNGSGKHWQRHIKKHGKQFVETIWVSELYHDKSIVDIALHFSKENNIVESDDWANQKPENGLDGTPPGTIFSEEHIANISYSNKGKNTKPKSEEHKANISASNKGKIRAPFSEEHRANISAARKGKSYSHKPHKPMTNEQNLVNSNNRKKKFFSIIETQKSYPKHTLSKYFPEFKQYY